jgi:hypothetical protein
VQTLATERAGKIQRDQRQDQQTSHDHGHDRTTIPKYLQLSCNIVRTYTVSRFSVKRTRKFLPCSGSF